MYHLLTGEVPFKNRGQIIDPDEKPFDIEGVSKYTRDIIMKCLEKDRSKRFANIIQITEALSSKDKDEFLSKITGNEPLEYSKSKKEREPVKQVKDVNIEAYKKYPDDQTPLTIERTPVKKPLEMKSKIEIPPWEKYQTTPGTSLNLESGLRLFILQCLVITLELFILSYKSLPRSFLSGLFLSSISFLVSIIIFGISSKIFRWNNFDFPQKQLAAIGSAVFIFLLIIIFSTSLPGLIYWFLLSTNWLLYWSWSLPLFYGSIFI